MALPKLRGYFSNHAICWNFGRFGLLALDPSLPRSFIIGFGVAFGVTQLLIGVSPNLLILALVTIASGFAYSVALTTVYNVLSDKMPAGVLSQATSIAVLGCSTGSIATTFVLSLLGTISSAPVFIFGFSGILMILVSFLAFGLCERAGSNYAAR